MRLFIAARPLAAINSSCTAANCSSRPVALPGQARLQAFSTSPACQSKTIKAHHLPQDLIPPYPYGERRVYKQSNRGLYGSSRIRFGNILGPKGLSKTRRFWRPNVHVKNFYVPELDARVKTRLTLRILKTIRREGGLVNYLLKSKPARIKELGPSGWRLRWLVMQTKPVQERFNEERKQLGLPPKEIVDRDDIIHYAMDYATPGGLNTRSRKTASEIQQQLEDEIFDLGEDLPNDTRVGDELSDEAEEALLKAQAAALSDNQMKNKPEMDGVREVPV